jgi:hypothetical protein
VRRPARPRVRFVLAPGCLALAAWLASCTFLVEFDEAPPAGDAGAAFRPPEAGAPDRIDAAIVDGGVDAHPCVRVDGGKPYADGKYCAGNGLGPYPGSPDDLITCKAGVASAVPCDAGCIFFRLGIPDACNECTGRPNGKYCGSVFPGWDDPLLDKLLVTCQGGRTGPYTECPTSCVVDGGVCK